MILYLLMVCEKCAVRNIHVTEGWKKFVNDMYFYEIKEGSVGRAYVMQRKEYKTHITF
jgi:hypothetical protein